MRQPLNANRQKLIRRALYDAQQCLKVCRESYNERPNDPAVRIFAPDYCCLKSQFRWQYGQLRAAVNGTYHSGFIKPDPNPGFAEFVYRRSIDTIE